VSGCGQLQRGQTGRFRIKIVYFEIIIELNCLFWGYQLFSFFFQIF